MLFALQFGKTQTFLAGKIFDYLYQKYEVSLHLKEIKISPFGGININHVFIEDHHKDTLIYVERLGASLFDMHTLKNKKISFQDIYILNGWVDDKTYKGDIISSLSVFTEKFKSPKKSKQPLKISFKNINADNVRYHRSKEGHSIVDFSKIGGHVKYLNLEGVNLELLTDSLSFKDIYGVNYRKLKAKFDYSLTQMNFENTRIITDNSSLKLDLKFKYKPGDFSDFVSNVKLNAFLDESKLSLQDIHKIYPHFKNGEKFNITSKLSGTLNDLKLDATEIISEDNKTKLNGDFLLKNSILDRNLFWFSATKAKIKFVPEDLVKIIPNQYHKNLPQKFYGLKQSKFRGSLYVSKTNLVLNGDFYSNLGSFGVNGSLDDLNKESKPLSFKIKKGVLLSNPFVKDFKNILFDGAIDGVVKKEALDLDTDLFFRKIQYKKLELSNSNLRLKLLNKDIKASFVTRDSLLSFKADIDYKNKEKNNKEYNIVFEITKAKLATLFPENVSYQKNVTGTGIIKVAQDKDNLLANGIVKNLHIETESDSLNVSNVDVDFLSKGKKKIIKLDSKKLVKLKVEGKFDFSEFEKLVENALYKFIPGSKTRTDIKDQTLSFGLEIYPEFLKSITSKVTLNKNLKASGVLDAKGDKGVIYANAPSFTLKDIEVDSLKIILDNSNKFINSNISVDKVKFKKQVYKNLSLLGKKINDTLFVRSNFKTDKINNRAVFHLTTHEDAINLGIENVYFKYLKSTWINKKDNKNQIHYNYKTGNWFFEGISFVNNDQEFEFNGNIKKAESKNLKLSLKHIKLDEILPEVDSLKIGGIASGEVFFKEKNTLLKPAGDLLIEDLKINGVNYGLLKTSIKPNNKVLGYGLKLNIINNDVRNIDATGEITVNKNKFLDSKIALDVSLNNLKLSSLSPLGRNVLSAIRGEANGRFKITGKLNNFNNYGTIHLKGAGLKFPYLNTNYNFSGNTEVSLNKKKIIFNKVSLEDNLYKTKGVLKGEINYDRYNNWDLDLRVDTSNLLVMNTQQEEDSKYFGTGFMDGFAIIKGPTSNLAINVTGKTLANTKFVLPISDVKQAESNRFIYFKEIKKDVDLDKKKKVEETGGLNIVLNLDITKDALGEVVIDQTSGSSLLGRVDGKMLIAIDRLFNIKMYGDLVVDEGLYNFKYGGIINKPFVVQKGGTVSWNGDPYKADLNIEAIHRVKANPKVLLESLSVNRKIDVDLVTSVTGELFESNQEFMVQIPNASSTVSSELDFKLNIDKDSRMRQFFSLLVSKTFFDENTLNNTGAVISSTTSELISNAVTDIFNNDGDKFQINFGYTAGESSDVEDLSIDNQIDIGVATEINERILINGKLGVPVGTSTQSAVVGEVKVEFLLNKKGTLRSSVFNRQNEIQYSEEEEGYTQGLGLNYQIDFNNLTEMLEILKFKKRKKDKFKKEEEEELVDDKIIK